jgi:ribose 5-phosphate isomerase
MSRQLAEREGIPIVGFDQVSYLDLTIDGADEVDPDLNVIKGGGGALLREKIVASLSRRVVIIVDSHKQVRRLGGFALPVEVVQFAWQPLAVRLAELGVQPVLRPGRDGLPLVTDEGNYILDCAFGRIEKPAALAALLNAVPGVVEHGLGGEREPAKDELAQYFRAVDAALREPLREQRVPLILAGVQYLLPIYREVSSYGHLADEELLGNPDHLSEHDLHARAWPLIRARQENARLEAVDKYWKLAGTGKTLDALHRIVPAAQQGRIESLFVDRTAHRWGTFDAATGSVTVRSSPTSERGDDDLLDYAAAETLLHRGSVYAVAADAVPVPPAAAILRY